MKRYVDVVRTGVHTLFSEHDMSQQMASKVK